MRLVIKQRGSVELNRVFLGDALYDFRRVKQPIAVVFPVTNVVGEILGNAIANGIYVIYLRCRFEEGSLRARLKPVSLLVHPLCHVSDGDHIGNRESSTEN